MPDTYQHPAERIGYVIQGAIKLAREIMDCIDRGDREGAKKRADQIILAVFDIPSEANAMRDAIERHKEDNKSLCESGIRMAQEINELRRYHAAESSQSAPLQIPLAVEPPHRAASGE